MDMQKQREGQTDGISEWTKMKIKERNDELEVKQDTVQEAEADVLAKTPEPSTTGEPNAEELEFLEADEIMKKQDSNPNAT